jgi:hypothetical protein
VAFAVSVAFIVVPVAFEGIIVTLFTVDVSMYVSLIGLTLAVSNSTIINSLPKRASETLLVVLSVVAPPCSPIVVVSTSVALAD